MVIVVENVDQSEFERRSGEVRKKEQGVSWGI